jgi:hypothetical protein
MQVILVKALGILGNILGGWLINLVMNRKFLEWSILYCARKLVQKTSTPHDDQFLDQIEKVIKEVPDAKPSKDE